LVRHAHSLSLQSFCRQHFQYGRAALRYRQIRAARRREPVRLEPFAFYRRLIGFPLRDERSWRAGARVALVGLSQAANAAGYLWERFHAP
jgi:hypothetical protein